MASCNIVVQAYTLGPCTKITACSRTAFPPNPSWMDPCWLSKHMSGDLQPADLSIKQCSLFEHRGRRFRPSSTDKVVVTSASHLLIDTGETKANVSRRAVYFSRTDLVKMQHLSVFRIFFSKMFFFILLKGFSIIWFNFQDYYLMAKKNPPVQSPFVMWWHNSLRKKVKWKQGNELSSQYPTQQCEIGFSGIVHMLQADAQPLAVISQLKYHLLPSQMEMSFLRK